jgi:hypothetical protein
VAGGFTAVRHEGGVEVLDADGNVVARTGRVYYIAIGPVTGRPGAWPTRRGDRRGRDLWVPRLPRLRPAARQRMRPSQAGRVVQSGAAPAPGVTRSGNAPEGGCCYQDAENIALTAKRALDRKYPTNPTLEQARAYYRELEKIDAAFLVSLEALESFATIRDFRSWPSGSTPSWSKTAASPAPDRWRLSTRTRRT